ncbi:NAD(+) diphosphatase [Aromatoleum petrolei]|uniref:NAD-capped RNA hydrolase NudC n=1 Tax=Aromatoleum petrolei TaxID=76116 RepID=A0ABX1MRI4_9RHOO|nr:NAD(+) diphosphatase [Aromatoleum petrolei]NMF89811.1 NAD(+) diphosphatase [Aromatoleum petrolei]QTQ35072.1 NADH pyrophosphatase [Aromatoleum petrolei]
MFIPGHLPPDPLAADDLCFVFRNTALLVFAAEGPTRVPVRCEPGGLDPAGAQHYIGSLAGRHCYAAATGADTQPPAGMEWRDLRSLFGRIDEAVFGVAGRGLQIVQWDLTHRFCGRCGSATALHASERSRVCPSCGQVHYPRLAPAVMALVRRGDQLLLARSPHFPEGMFSALAGFVEPGESLEQTIAREVREEVGIEVANLRYFGSQSWPFPHSLMLAFTADYAGGELALQADEIEAADWFPIDRLPRLPHRFSIARRLIDATVEAIAARTD